MMTDIPRLRKRLLQQWGELGVRGRVFVGDEGINAQVIVPLETEGDFETHVRSLPLLDDVALNRGSRLDLNSPGAEPPFTKLIVRHRGLVADGLGLRLQVPAAGVPMRAPEWHQRMQAIADGDEGIVVDTRNHYEHRVGYFEQAELLDVDTFRDVFGALDEVVDKEKAKPDTEILLYCTGGIRCEKVGAYLKQVRGFTNVRALEGGINAYKTYVDSTDQLSRFRGTNFVFDQRKSERVSEDLCTTCDQCARPCDRSTNCIFCDLLFVQCASCESVFHNHCTEECRLAMAQPPHVRSVITTALRKANKYPGSPGFVRPKFSERTSVRYSDIWKQVPGLDDFWTEPLGLEKTASDPDATEASDVPLPRRFFFR